MDYYENFRRNVIYLRRTHGMTQKQMAEILGISAGTLGRLESGQRVRVNSGMLIRLCDHFGLSVDHCLYRELSGYGIRDTAT